MSKDGQLVPLGATSTLLPTAITSLNTSSKLPETVIMSRPLPFLPFSIKKPLD